MWQWTGLCNLKISLTVHRSLKSLSVVFVVLFVGVAAAIVPPARYTRYDEVEPILAEAADALPPGAATRASLRAEAPWNAWIASRDTEIRARLARGDEDTIINWLLFGTSFTAAPRVLLETSTIGEAAVVRRAAMSIGQRIEDFLRAMAAPGTDERRRFARRFLEEKGYSFGTPAEVGRVREHVLEAIQHMAEEQLDLSAQVGGTGTADAATDFERSSRLFQARGLSLDTSLAPNFALDRSLAAMKARGLLSPGGVRRVAIVGAGLDFADKDAGFDFYPQQTVQPFAVLDSLRRLGLAPAGGDAEIVALDISPRIIDHITRARSRALAGASYTLRLPLPRNRAWLPEFRDYWKAFGDQIGVPAPVTVSRAIAAQTDVRAVRLPPATVQHLSVADLNIITQRLDGQAFDLVIATNVLIYYDTLDQSIALANIDAMLGSAGFLLTNTELPVTGASSMELVDALTTIYTGAQDGDHILWYRRKAGPLR